MWAWGSQDNGQLGVVTPSYEDIPIPAPVSASNGAGCGLYYPLKDVSDIAAGGYHNLALKNDGHVWAWGFNDFGQTGQRSLAGIESCARQVPGLDHVTHVAAGDSFSLALKADGTVWAWGRNDLAQLGAPSGDKCGPQLTLSCSYSPIQVKRLAGVEAIAAGGAHALALTTP